MVRGLWGQQDDAIIDVKLGNADADSYKYETMTALLALWYTINKDKHGKHCHNQRKMFSLFVFSVDSMLGREDLVVLTQLNQTMAEKMDEPIFHARVWINGQIETAVAISYPCMIRRARLPSSLRDRETDWDLESGIGLAH